jgi:stalled ribosome rescue protein Dom34
MTTTKYLGIWMDHANANIIEFADGPLETNIIRSQFTHEVKEDVLGRSEYGMHKKEQHQQSDFYKKIGEVIRNYTDVILFGPTKAKTELFNMLREDHNFEKIAINVLQTSKMTNQQQHAFVRDYFSIK